MADIDMSQYLDLFLQEADEQLSILEQQTLKLESDASDERLQIIFRAAHTLKGSSRAMGFTHFGEVTHEMENVLDLLRTNQVSVSTEIIDCLFQCLDVLTSIKEQIAAGNGDQVECADLVKRLQAISASGGAPVTSSPEPVSSAKPQPKLTELSSDHVLALQAAQVEGPIYHAVFQLSEECVMKWVRAFMAINAVSEHGEMLLTFPSIQELEDEAFEFTFEAYFQTHESIASIEQKLGQVGELEKALIVEWTLEEHEDEPVSATTASEPSAESAETSVIASDAQDPKKAAPKKTETGQTVRVDVARLDELMNLVGELVIDRTRVAQIGAELVARYQYDHSLEALGEVVGHISRITGDLQDQIMKARMLPIETVFNRFPRMMRDLTQKVGKEINLVMIGGETELDRSVIEVIGDPLIHILRNSADHGVEMPDEREAAGKPRQGSVTISARHQENHIVIEIVDDGKGIDPERIRAKAVSTGLLTKDAAEKLSDKEALQLIFHSGLSTAEQVTEVSGRGVGMDIVRSNVQKLGGVIDLESTVGVGTRFGLRLPLTLAIIRGLLVKVSGVVYVLPLTSVVETLLVEESEIQKVHKREVIVLRGMTTPLVRLREKFVTRQFSDSEDADQGYVVIVGLADQRIGLMVDKLVGEQEVVIKSLSRFCGDVRGISGATILGDGNVALILDINNLVTEEAA